MKLYNKLIIGGLTITLLMAGGCINTPAPPAQLPASSGPLPLVSSEPAKPESASEESERQEAPARSNPVEDTPDEYAKIRAEIPFLGLLPAKEWTYLPIETDARGKELAWALTLIGAPDKDIESAVELDNDFMIKQALQAAPLLDGSETWLDASDPLYQPSLKPIAAAVEDGQMTLREHVEAAARLLYGDTVKLTHRSVMGEKWKWHEKEGVYTPPHMSGGMTVAGVLEYEQITNTRYQVKCVFVRMSEGGMADDKGDLITEVEFNNAIQTRVRQREMVVQRNEDDGFMLISHRFL